jgi:hypothetical protein
MGSLALSIQSINSYSSYMRSETPICSTISLPLDPCHQNRPARIRCQLIPITITEAAGRYYALSYTWGDPKNRLPITIDRSTDINLAIFSPMARQERELNVTVNLEAALRRIRESVSNSAQYRLI